MTVIAMTRELGSRGRDVALGLADRLGLEIVHHEVVEHDLAVRLTLPESAVHHFLEGQASLLERWKIDHSRLSFYTKEEILKLAYNDNVLIRGWGAAQLLRSIGNVPCIRVCAPMRYREDVLLARVSSLKDREEARAEIERNDAAHAKVIQTIFKADWQDSEQYDMVLNTELLSIDFCVNQIAQLVALPNFQQTKRSRRALADRLIEVRIHDGFYDLNKQRGFATALQISVAAGKVSLRGIVGDNEVAKMIERTVLQTEGVIEVDNHMQIMPAARNIG